MKEELRQKLKESDMTASQFLDGLTELLCDNDGLTTDEIREDLEYKGVDTEAFLNRIRVILEVYGFTPYP